MSKKTIIIASSLMLAGLVIFAVALYFSGAFFTWMDLSESESNSESKTYTVTESFKDIAVDTDEADVIFKTSDNGVRVVCSENDQTKFKAAVEDGTLKISCEDDRPWYSSIGWFRKELKVTVYLPAKEYGALTVDSSTGDVSLPAGLKFSDISVTGSTGKVECESGASGSLRIKLSTGDIRLGAISADSVDLNVTTGGINVGSVNCKGDMTLGVSTGEARLTDVKCGSLSTTGTTGDITINKVAVSGAIDIERSTGDVRFENCGAGSIRVKTSTGDVTGTLSSPMVFTTKTSTGDVSVPDSTSGGKCDVTTTTGDIQIKISAK